MFPESQLKFNYLNLSTVPTLFILALHSHLCMPMLVAIMLSFTLALSLFLMFPPVKIIKIYFDGHILEASHT
jgi:hypothetical protein